MSGWGTDTNTTPDTSTSETVATDNTGSTSTTTMGRWTTFDPDTGTTTIYETPASLAEQADAQEERAVAPKPPESSKSLDILVRLPSWNPSEEEIAALQLRLSSKFACWQKANVEMTYNVKRDDKLVLQHVKVYDWQVAEAERKRIEAEREAEKKRKAEEEAAKRRAQASQSMSSRMTIDPRTGRMEYGGSDSNSGSSSSGLRLDEREMVRLAEEYMRRRGSR